MSTDTRPDDLEAGSRCGEDPGSAQAGGRFAAAVQDKFAPLAPALGEYTMSGKWTPAPGAEPMEFTGRISAEARERGLIARAGGENILLAPPLCTTREEIDEIIGILAASVEAAAPPS